MRQLSALVLTLGMSALAAAPAAAERSLPTFESVTRIVEREFASKPRFERGDIISRIDVEPIIDQLIELGWRPGDVEEVYDAFLPDDATVVVLLRTENGRQLMRQVGKLPGAYDRLERLTWVADGSKRLKQLIADPKAAATVQKWTTAEGAQQMQTVLASDSRGANFALPTGHIHTMDEFLAKLKKAHTAALKKTSKAD